MAVGTVFENYDCHMMPGWLDGTVGYHVDDGKIFARGCEDLGREVEGNTLAIKNLSVFLSCFNINLLALYHECRSLIGYATHYLFSDR